MSLPGQPNVLGRSPTAPGGSAGVVGGATSSTANALARFSGTGGLTIQNGVITEDDYTGALNGPLNNTTTTAAGSAFANQPSNDSVGIVSSNAGDTTQSATIIGTTTGGNVTVTETIALNGTSGVTTTKVNWGLILAVKLSASCAGTVTFSKTTGAATITTITTTNLSKGVNTVSAGNQPAYNRVVDLVGSAATTKQIGLQGTNSSGVVIYDSIALNGTTVVPSNSAFLTVTEIYSGDLEGTRTATETAHGAQVLNVGSLLLGSATGPGFYFGAGAPTMNAAQGSVYLNTSGSSTSTRLYINTTGAATWTNVVTAA